MYIFNVEKGGNSNFGYVTADGTGTYSARTDLAAAKFWTLQAPSGVEFKGRLWLAWINPNETTEGSGRYYVFVASTGDGKMWTEAAPLLVEGSDAGVDGYAASTDKVALAVHENALWVLYTGAEDGPKTYRTRLNPFGSGDTGKLYTRYIPSWEYSHASAVAMNPKYLYVFCHVTKEGTEKGAVYLTDVTEDGYFNNPINLGNKVEAFTNKTPTAMVVPGFPRAGFPWRVWLHCKGKTLKSGDDKHVYEHSFSI
jgi:hypothetical protein